MKISWINSTLLSALSLPGVLAAEIAGASLPANLSLGLTFGLFVAGFVLLTLTWDYTRARPARFALAPADSKAAHPLAA